MSFFVFSSRRRHTRLVSDWSSDVCSSDLTLVRETAGIDLAHATEAELRGALKRKDIADVGTLSGAKLVDEVFKNFVEPTLVQPTFVLDYPVALSPLAKLKRGDATRVERWELFIQKREIANSFSELNDPEEQDRMSVV